MLGFMVSSLLTSFYPLKMQAISYGRDTFKSFVAFDFFPTFDFFPSSNSLVQLVGDSVIAVTVSLFLKYL